MPIFISNSFALDVPVFTPDGGDIITPIQVRIVNPNADGIIFYTTDGTDPRKAQGGVRSSARPHFSPFSVNRSMTVNSRIKSGNDWSELKTVAFAADQDFSNLLITEVMYHPTDKGPEYSEFIEFKNIGNTALDLSNLRLIGNHNFEYFISPPEGPIVPPGEFFLLIRNSDIFQELYPDVPYHGSLSGEMDNSSEAIALVGPDGSVATNMRYETHAPWAVVPDNHGYFEDSVPDIGFSLTRKTLDPKKDPEHFNTWRASASRFGSPGADDPEPNVPPLLINEIRTRSAGEFLDSVEIYNPTSSDVEIGGWWLSVQRNWPYEYQFAADMIVPGKGYLVVDESDFIEGDIALTFSSISGRCYLFSGDPHGELTGYSHGISYMGSDRNSSLGLLRTSEGLDFMLPEIAPSFEKSNTGLTPPSLVISEIMSQSYGEGVPYIELHNPGPTPLALWEPDNPLCTWGISINPYYFEGPQTLFTENTIVPPGGYLICAPESFDPQSIPDDVGIVTIPDYFAPTGNIIRILRPSGDKGGNTRYVVVDEVEYRNKTPWDIGAAGGGQGLERIGMNSLGSDPRNWCAGPVGGTPGIAWNGTCARPIAPEVSIDLSDGEFTLSFSTNPDSFYSLEESSDLETWHRLPEPAFAGNGSRMSVSRNLANQMNRTYLRVVIGDKP